MNSLLMGSRIASNPGTTSKVNGGGAGAVDFEGCAAIGDQQVGKLAWGGRGFAEAQAIAVETAFDRASADQDEVGADPGIAIGIKADQGVRVGGGRDTGRAGAGAQGAARVAFGADEPPKAPFGDLVVRAVNPEAAIGV